ncbi:MAG: hypothetical protein R2774_11755 [Saprospiraceae bacterium]
MKILYFILGFALFASCKEAPLNIENQRIKAALDKKKEEYILSQLKQCKRDIVAKAEQNVDSLVASEFLLVLSDSVIFPERPAREIPYIDVIIADTLKANPIF